MISNLTLSSAMDWLLGLNNQDVKWSDPNTSLGFVYQLPGWAWLLIALMTIALATWSYHRLLGNRKIRISLSFVRTALILLAIALICTPIIRLQDQEEEKDVVIMLVDRTKSMLTPDAIAKSFNQNQVITRDQLLKKSLDKIALNSKKIKDKLGKNRKIVWRGFGGSTQGNKEIFEIKPNDIGDAKGKTTKIKTALLKSVNSMGGKYVAAIGLLSDGQSPLEKIDHTILNKINTPIHTFLVGGDASQSFLSITEANIPERSYVNDIVPITVKLEQYPKNQQIDLDKITVAIINKETGLVIDKKVGLDNINEKITLTAQSQEKGIQNWQVIVSYDAGPTQAGDALVTLKDNIKQAKIEFIDKKIRVLYVDAYPRWEYRYLKSMLIRETSINSSMLLISSGRQYTQEGDTPIKRLPQTADEFKEFDVIIVGDVHENYWSEQQKQLLKEHVGKRGAGILFIGGNESMPYTYAQQPLVDLMPMINPEAVKPLDYNDSLVLTPSPYAAELNVLRLKKEGASNGSAKDKFWPDNLPPLWWVQDLGQLKPLAMKNVLANVTDANSDKKSPAIILMPYGSGKSLYIASDEFWRWRYGLGEHYHQQYWVQLIRMLARYRLQKQNDSMMLSVPQKMKVDNVGIIALTIDDPTIVSQNLAKIKVGIFNEESENDQPDYILELLAKQETSTEETTIQVANFEGKWVPENSGKFQIRILDGVLDVDNVQVSTRVIDPSDETFAPVDKENMNNIASISGGKVYKISEIEKMFDALPPPRKINIDKSASIRQSPLLMFLVVLLITAEWLGRKKIKLI